MAMEFSPRSFLPRRIRAMALALVSIWFLPISSYATCKREAVDLPVTISGTRPVIAAKINGADVHFILDSGAFFSMITSPAAEELNLKTRMAPLGLRVAGIGGTTVPSVATVKAFTLANITLPNIEFLVGGSSVGSGSIGVLGQNFLEKWDVEYNLAQGMIRLMKDEDCRKAMLAYWVKPDDPVSLIEIARTTPMKPHTTGFAYVNGVKIRVAFDTGAAISMMSRRAAEHAGIKLDAAGVVDAGFVGGTGSGMAKSYIAPVESFKFADGEEIKHTRLRIVDLDLEFTDMLIGADFFLSHRIFVANSQNKLYLTYNGGPVFNLAKSTAAAPQVAAEPQGAASTQSAEAANEPADAAAFVRRGTAFAGRKDYDRALIDLTRACELQPANPDYFFERGQIYVQKSDSANALTDFNRVLELKPDHQPALMIRAQLRLDIKNTTDARSDLDAIDKLAAKQADVRFEMAMAFERANWMPSAITQLDLWIRSHEEDSRMPIALAARCRARAVLGQELAQALKDCNRALSGSFKGSNPGILDSRAFVRLRLGDYDKAIEDYDAALRMNPQMPAALYGRGIAKIRKKKIAEGDADMTKAATIAPKIAQEFTALGIAP
jgi:tetratricopeptide (TPR) repeat protein/predicted aspartyl protease